MTQLSPDAAGVGAAGAAEETDARRGSPHAGTGRDGRRAAVWVVLTVIVAVAIVAAAGFGPVPRWWAVAAVALVTAIYLAAVVFQLLMVFYGSARMTRLGTGDTLPDEELPLYTVLVPFAGAGRRSGTGPGVDRIADLIAELSALDYPVDRLQVLLLAADGGEYATVTLPAHFGVVAVGSPSRADACAAGLARTRGELCVVYEPGQRPDRGQLRAAASSFRKLPAWVVGLRPETRCRNPRANWLTQYAAAESAVRSVLLVRGLDRLQLPVPVGGFACHYRTDALRRLDPWQDGDRAEGADIGARIAGHGWSVRMLASVVSEEAEDRLGRWLRQREASIRDDYRSWLAQTRLAYRLWRELGPLRSAAFQLTTGSAAITALVNPLLWLLTLLWLAGGSQPIAEALTPAGLYTVLAVTLLGILLTAYSLMVGCMEHHIFVGARNALLAPVYVALTSVAAYRALLPGPRPFVARSEVRSVATS